MSNLLNSNTMHTTGISSQGVSKRKNLVRQQLPSHEGEGQGWGV